MAAHECPLQQLAKLGQLAAEVHFILRRNGPSLNEGPHKGRKDRRPPLQSLSKLEPVRHKGPQKTPNLDPSTLPRRTKPKQTLSSSLVELTEPQRSTVTPQKTRNTVNPLLFPDPLKEESVGEILQQQEKLRELEAQIEALEKETEVWEKKVTSAGSPDPVPGLAQEVEELEFQLKQNEVDLMYEEDWEKELHVEMDREQGQTGEILNEQHDPFDPVCPKTRVFPTEMQRRLDQIHSSIDDQNDEIKALQERREHLEEHFQVQSQTVRPSPERESQQTGEALLTLTEELHNRLQRREEMEADLSRAQWELQRAEERVKVTHTHTL